MSDEWFEKRRETRNEVKIVDVYLHVPSRSTVISSATISDCFCLNRKVAW